MNRVLLFRNTAINITKISSVNCFFCRPTPLLMTILVEISQALLARDIRLIHDGTRIGGVHLGDELRVHVRKVRLNVKLTL